MPAGVVLAVPLDAGPSGTLAQFCQADERLLHLRLGPHDAHQRLHGSLQVVLDLVGVLAPAPRSNGASAARIASSTAASLTVTLARSRARAAAYSPARLPNTIRSESELPPSRFAPLMPDAHSPAANSPGMDDSWVSASTRIPPMM